MPDFLKRRVAWVLGGVLLLAIAGRSTPPSQDSPQAIPSEPQALHEALRPQPALAPAPAPKGVDAPPAGPRPPESSADSRAEWLKRREQHQKEQEPREQAAERKAAEARKFHEEQNELLRRARHPEPVKTGSPRR